MLAAGLRPGDPASPVASSLEFALDGPVAVDRQLVSRLMVNLLVNAREALEGPGGRIAVGAALEDGEGPGRGCLRLAVTDNGRGMSEEFVRQSLFRPFSTTKSAGLGIGLAQCKSIVDAHGGRIRVESRQGQGTTFTIELPVDVLPAAAKGAV